MKNASGLKPIFVLVFITPTLRSGLIELHSYWALALTSYLLNILYRLLIRGIIR